MNGLLNEPNVTFNYEQAEHWMLCAWNLNICRQHRRFTCVRTLRFLFLVILCGGSESASFSDWTVLWFSLDNCVSNTIIWLITIWFKWGHTSFPCFWWGSLQLARFWQYTDTVIEMPRTVNIVALYKVTFTFVPFYPSTPMTTIIRNHLLTNHRGLSFPPKRIARDLPHLPSNSCLVSYLEGALPILAKPDRVESMYLCKTCWNCSAWVQVVWEAVASWGF